MVLLLLFVPAAPSPPWVPALGLCLVAAGEAVRLWGVRHIGVVSRTRSDRLGPLVAAGPFAYVRNPLYLGNLALWVGFCLSARTAWLAPVVLGVLAAEYHAIVRWEEALLHARWGQPYAAYLDRVPRWLPAWPSRTTATPVSTHSWGDTLYSERGTLIAIVLGFGLLALKQMVSADSSLNP